MTGAEYERLDRRRWAQRLGVAFCNKVRWRSEEDERALDMRARGKSYGQIAIRVRRTPDAVAARLRYVGAGR